MSSLKAGVERWLPRHTARGRWARCVVGAAATACLLAVCGRMEAPWFALLFVALVPWLWALDSADSTAEATAAGAMLSVAFAGLVFPWFPSTVERYSGAGSLPVWLLFLVAAPLLEPQFIAFALVRHLARKRVPFLGASAAAAMVYVGTELVLPKLFFDTLGLGLYPSVYLRQGADLLGVHGLTLLVLATNELVRTSLRRAADAPGAAPSAGRAPTPMSTRTVRALVCALGLVALATGYGALRVAQLRESTDGSGHVVGIVQANITSYDKLRAEKGAFETVRLILETHMALSEQIRERSQPDLIVWPETVYPTTFGNPKSEAGAAFDDEIRGLVGETGIPLVFGAYDAEAGREFNAAFFLGAPGRERPPTSYRKRMLFPLTEWVPAAIDSDWLRRELPWLGHWERGPGARVVELPLRGDRSLSVVPLICYDVLFPGFVAEAARGGADLIVTLSNDSWFPDERAPRLHLISAAFRSVETRLPQVRATNSGISAMIAPTGELLATTAWDRRETLVGRLGSTGRSVTLAMVLGPWLGPLLLGGALVLLFALRRRPGLREPGEPLPQSKRRKRTKPGTRTK
ncbi:apolipoprotein N-acyltransferase [Chondromyces crocatus]|uniref:Apolipoprotein N-acyltransferase n=1 Tax=Chondromyces crocatus TaxID=52 RepID=A0A0K1ESM0_CHOCO|nr:apolipoprotein N-acyltransferase [Chondromyces crocatus]AKT43637.1 apolipoprotein N-acyltransferase [Chondromyces crocatus]